MKNNSDIELAQNLKSLGKDGLINFIDFASSAAAYGYITTNAQQYIRDLEVAKLLGGKFSASGIFEDAQSAKDWLYARLEVNPNNLDQIFRRLQGDGAGEVDVVRAINGSLKGLLYKAEYATNSAGDITSNVPGIDVVVKSRFTGKIVQQIQVKSNWSNDPHVLKQTIDNFLHNPNYNEHIVLSGPKELIEVAKEMNIKNPLMVYGNVEHNRESAERLMKIVEQGDFKSYITFGDVVGRISEGALIGAVIGIGISSLNNYLLYRRGEISLNEAFKNIAVDGSRRAIVGGIMGGLSLIFPPGIIGIGIGIAVGTSIRKVVDLAYGKGDYERVVREMYITNDLSKGLLHFALTTDEAIQIQRQFLNSMIRFEQRSKILNKISKETDEILNKIIEEI